MVGHRTLAVDRERNSTIQDSAVELVQQESFGQPRFDVRSVRMLRHDSVSN